MSKLQNYQTVYQQYEHATLSILLCGQTEVSCPYTVSTRYRCEKLPLFEKWRCHCEGRRSWYQIPLPCSSLTNEKINLKNMIILVSGFTLFMLTKTAHTSNSFFLIAYQATLTFFSLTLVCPGRHEIIYSIWWIHENWTQENKRFHRSYKNVIQKESIKSILFHSLLYYSNRVTLIS